MNPNKTARVSLAIVFITVLVVFAAIAQPQQAAQPQSGPTILPMNDEQLLTFQNLLKDQEILRLRICASQDPPVPERECGQLVMRGVARIPKPSPAPPKAAAEAATKEAPKVAESKK